MHAVWVEVPVLDLDRALAFYQTVFGLQTSEVGDDGTRRTTTLVNTSEGRPGLSLNQTANFMPSRHGPLVYLDAGGAIDSHLERIPAAGGKIVDGKTSMGTDMGYYAIFEDSEGNQFALYSFE
jgi:predicted enzyme related to lactoylglutathione lyase